MEEIILRNDQIAPSNSSGTPNLYEDQSMNEALQTELEEIKPDEVEKLGSDHPLALTLVTCDTDNEYRLVVKSIAINQ